MTRRTTHPQEVTMTTAALRRPGCRCSARDRDPAARSRPGCRRDRGQEVRSRRGIRAEPRDGSAEVTGHGRPRVLVRHGRVGWRPYGMLAQQRTVSSSPALTRDPPARSSRPECARHAVPAPRAGARVGSGQTSLSALADTRVWPGQIRRMSRYISQPRQNPKTPFRNAATRAAAVAAMPSQVRPAA